MKCPFMKNVNYYDLNQDCWQTNGTTKTVVRTEETSFGDCLEESCMAFYKELFPKEINRCRLCYGTKT